MRLVLQWNLIPGQTKVDTSSPRLQKISNVFDFQTTTRLDEFLLIDLAMAELRGGMKLWEYFEKSEQTRPKPTPRAHETVLESTTGRGTINILRKKVTSKDPNTGETTTQYVPAYSVGTGKDARNTSSPLWDNGDIQTFLDRMQEQLCPKWMPKLQVRTEHRVGKQIYRGHPHFMGKHWRDWALIDWGGDNEPEPACIWCFVVLYNLPKSDHKRTKHRKLLTIGGTCVQSGAYAVVECASWKKEDQPVRIKTKSRIFRRLKLEMAANTAGSKSTSRRFYLVKVEKIKGPLFVVPDVGNKNRREYFSIKPRKEQWANEFEHWMDTVPLPEAYKKDPAGLQFGLHQSKKARQSQSK